MHSPPEQDVLDLISVPSTHVDTSSSIINAYLNPEFQYNLQLTSFSNCLNTTDTTPIDLFWSTTQQSSPTNTDQISNTPAMLPQRLVDSDFPANGSNLSALSQQDMAIDHQQYRQDPNHFDQGQQQFLSGAIPPTVPMKYHRSMSHLCQPSNHQQPVTQTSFFSHRTSLPDIYPVKNKTNKHYQNNHTYMNDQLGSDYNKTSRNTAHPTIDSDNYGNSYCNTTPLLTWNQSLGQSYHHLRPTSTLDDSTRKRTKSMDYINHKSAKMGGQQQFQSYQHFTPFQPQYKEPQQEQKKCQYYQQKQYQDPQQQKQPQTQPLQHRAKNMMMTLDQNSARAYAEDKVINTLSPPYQHQHASPTIKSPMSAVSSLSTISSTNTTKHPDDDIFDKEEKQQSCVDFVDGVDSMIKKCNEYPKDCDINDIKNGIPCSDNLDDYSTCENLGNMEAKKVPTDVLSSLHAEPTNDITPQMDLATFTSQSLASRSTMSSAISAPSSSSPSSSTTSSSSSSSSAHTEYNYPILSEADMDAVTRDTSAMPRRQNPRYDADSYTPRWVRYTGQQKQGYCESCQPMGKWLQLKNSAYWYHKQFFHGISSVSGQPFTSPLEQRVNKESDLLEGLCHQCLQFVPICNTKRKNSVLWYRHAHKCHIYDKPKPKASQQSHTVP